MVLFDFFGSMLLRVGFVIYNAIYLDDLWATKQMYFEFHMAWYSSSQAFTAFDSTHCETNTSNFL